MPTEKLSGSKPHDNLLHVHVRLNLPAICIKLILQALQLKEETATVEMKEQQLVLDCVKQLGGWIAMVSERTHNVKDKDSRGQIVLTENASYWITNVTCMWTNLQFSFEC